MKLRGKEKKLADQQTRRDSPKPKPVMYEKFIFDKNANPKQ